jgi:predicted ATP-dependent serine protease
MGRDLGGPARKLGKPCYACKTLIPAGDCRCPNPKCKEWNFGGAEGETPEIVFLSDATISEVPRLRTLHPEMDRFFGGKEGKRGLAQKSTTLVAGPPGSGKTTLLLELCDFIIPQLDRPALYVANEQQPDELRAKGLELGLQHMSRIGILPAMGGFNGNLFDICIGFKPGIIIVDSLTKLVGRDLELAVLVAASMKEVSVACECPTFLINQVTKELDHSGSEKLQHEVDMTALFYVEGQTRILSSDKNRNGPAPMMLAMRMKSEEDFARGRGGLEVIGLTSEEAEKEEEDAGPVNTIGTDEENRPKRRRERMKRHGESEE